MTRINPRHPRLLYILIPALMLLAAVSEFSVGRRPWGVNGRAGLWSGDINSEHNSQFVADPYSFTHITHGVLFYGLTRLIFRSVPSNVRLIIAVGAEAGWEVLENTDAVINRYRAETVSLNYYGDSIVNSMTDVLACIIGFVLASRLPTRVTVLGTIMIEIVLAIWIRDNLTLNILMLIHPLKAVRMWQLGQ
jgi:hypothetical protein